MAKRGADKRNIWKKEWRTPLCVIGIDQSYTRTGITVSQRGKIKFITSVDFKGLKSKTEKRKAVCDKLNFCLDKCLKQYQPQKIIVIVERIRMFTQTVVLSQNYMTTTAGLVSAIVDTAYWKGVKTYSVDTRAWKSAVLGSSKPSCEPLEGCDNPQKIASVRHIIDLGFEEQIRITGYNNRFVGYNDDAADSANISLYGFLPVEKIYLHREE